MLAKSSSNRVVFYIFYLKINIVIFLGDLVEIFRSSDEFTIVQHSCVSIQKNYKTANKFSSHRDNLSIL